MAAQAMIRTSWGMLFMLFISILISQAGAKSDTQAVNHTQDSPQLFPAVVPIGINIPEGNPDFPDRQATFAKIVRGIKDAVAMARIACLFINEEAEEYKRYFEPGHADFVKSVFCNIGYVPPWVCTPDQFKTYNLPPNPLFANLRITAGQDFDVSESMREEEEDATYTGTLYQTMLTSYNVGPDDDHAVIELRKRAFDYPSIGDIHVKRGFKNLGTKDSGKMTTLGSLILHELCHWRLMTRANGNEAVFDSLVDQTIQVEQDDGSRQPEEVDWIIDYLREEHDDPEIEPEDGYGPQHARVLEANGHGDSFRNADNYRWCATSIWWRFTYRYQFQAQDDNDQGDKLTPEGSNGAVPYPGETLQSRGLFKDLYTRQATRVRRVFSKIYSIFN